MSNLGEMSTIHYCFNLAELGPNFLNCFLFVPIIIRLFVSLFYDYNERKIVQYSFCDTMVSCAIYLCIKTQVMSV